MRASAVASNAVSTLTVAETEAEHTMPTASGIGGRRPIADRFDFDTRRLAAPNQYIVAAYAYLQRPVHETAADDGAFGARGEPHVGQSFPDLLADHHAQNPKRSARGRV